MKTFFVNLWSMVQRPRAAWRHWRYVYSRQRRSESALWPWIDAEELEKYVVRIRWSEVKGEQE